MFSLLIVDNLIGGQLYTSKLSSSSSLIFTTATLENDLTVACIVGLYFGILGVCL